MIFDFIIPKLKKYEIPLHDLLTFSEFLLKSVKVNIVFVDEYGTSKEADFILRGKKKSVKKKANDLIAAVLILENYLNIVNKNN